MRVTIDCDRKQEALTTFWKGLVRIKKAPDIIRVSSRGNGFHFVWLNACSTFSESIALRKAIGDDVKRIWIDEQAADKPKQIMWNSKTMDSGERFESKRITVDEFLEMMR